MKKPYANTTVTVNKSRSEIAMLLEKHGVMAVQWTTVGASSLLRFQFDYENRSFFVRFVVDPERQGTTWKWSPRGPNKETHLKRQACRLHRVLYFAVKSKLEVIESGLQTPFVVWLPQIEAGGSTVSGQLDAHVDQLSGPKATLPSFLSLPPLV